LARTPDSGSALHPIGETIADNEDAHACPKFFPNMHALRRSTRRPSMLHYAVVFFIILAIASFLFGRNRGA
jgi:hypothetical protein